MAEFLVIAGLSGAGRSTAAAIMEDFGWFIIDNMPPSLIPTVAKLTDQTGSEIERMVFVVGRTFKGHGVSESSNYITELNEALQVLRSRYRRLRVLFLDASQDILIRRFESTRRRHPLAAENSDTSVADAIYEEKRLLSEIKDKADLVIDTTELSAQQLRSRMIDVFVSRPQNVLMQIAVVSFGFKYGIPLDVDLVFDCRFIPNPYWIEELRELTGLDDKVRKYVLDQPSAIRFLSKLQDMMELLIPAYQEEGKSYLTIALGCTGGRHRSVVLARELVDYLDRQGFSPLSRHRDIAR
ncbi:MAG: RNase adapter RapZ [Actinobacteria bacterium]|nr:RNase adapter RapZ [Actinomycetota bacterium]MCL6104471.1 RNase adapter RapZ [Actinomycetota bacterium]